MSDLLSGASRVHFIVGDPIAQVKSPANVTRAYHERGLNAYVMPAHVAPTDLVAWLAGVSLAKNVDGIIATVPHKFACFELCATTSDRAAFLRRVNRFSSNFAGFFGELLTPLVNGIRVQGPFTASWDAKATGSCRPAAFPP